MADAARTAVRVVMLGAPGAGKGTQAERFAKAHGIPRISTGDILREAVSEGTPLGRAAKATMDAGRLVSDEIMIGVVKERLERKDADHGFVLDGFPRTVAQAEALDKMIDGSAPLVIVDVEVPEDVLVKRLAGRRICGNCGWNALPAIERCARCGGPLVQRSDDGEQVVRERLRIYANSTQPLVDFYSRRATFRSVDGDQTLESVAADLAAAVASVVGGR
ncbi:MAG: adenylate kinase [Acidobacteria bacterium]|nr:MAG: adenylate kinase [Acidobacteriota bacterium]